MYPRTSCYDFIKYYETIQVTVGETGTYTFVTNTTNTYGYIYKDNFDPFNLTENLLSEDDKSDCSGRFKLITRLQVNTTYVLVVTMTGFRATGAFSVLIFGPNNISLDRIGESR